MILSNNIVKQIIVITLIALLFESCNKEAKTEKSDTNQKTPAVAENIDPDCVEFVALWAAGDIAERIGKDRKWIFLNYLELFVCNCRNYLELFAREIPGDPGRSNYL